MERGNKKFSGQLFKITDVVKIQMAILQIHYYFLLTKCENPVPGILCIAKDSNCVAKDSHIFSTKK